MRDRSVEIPGPWIHRYVAANGARFHVAEATPDVPASSAAPAGSAPEDPPSSPASAGAPRASRARPLVLLLHGFPEFWWAWRDQLPALDAAGYRAVAMDLRGYGGSDKTPRGYDPLTLAADVAGLIRALGARRAVVVGQGWGGYVGWATAAAHPDHVQALCTVAAPHPTELLRNPFSLLARAPISHVAAMQVPWLPERAIMRGTYVARHLSSWAAPESGFPADDVVERYREALALWPSPHCALEYHRWLVRSRFRADGRSFAQLMRRPLDVPVLHINGAANRAVDPAAIRGSSRHVRGPFTNVALPGAGHFPQEETPQAFNAALLAWLLQRART